MQYRIHQVPFAPENRQRLFDKLNQMGTTPVSSLQSPVSSLQSPVSSLRARVLCPRSSVLGLASVQSHNDYPLDRYYNGLFW